MLPKYLTGLPETNFDCAISLEIPETWESIVREAVDKILLIAPNIKFDQIKAKWGGLRIYMREHRDETEEIIREAEMKVAELSRD